MTRKKYSVENDPNRSDEAQKYENPIPSREVILEYLQDAGFPVTLENVADALDLFKPAQIKALGYRLSAMVRDGQLEQNQFYYRPVGHQETIVTGKVNFSKDGLASLYCQKHEQPAYIPARQARALFPGDEITAKITGLNRKDKLEAHIQSILKRNTEEVIGRFYTEFDGSYIRPISKTIGQDIALLPFRQQVETGALVKAKILLQPSMTHVPVGKFLEVIEEQSPILEAISMASKRHNLVEEWHTETLAELEKLPEEVRGKDLENRVDLREMPFVTIDGEDAKDFDDAVYVEKTKSGGWKLYVAIADVSYYVRTDTAIDREARQRSTSVYFPGYVIPMTHEKISNGLCSLVPNKDRLSLVCEMNISKAGKLTRYKFYSAVINSKARLTYTEVAKLLKNDPNNIITQQHPQLEKHLRSAHQLFELLLQERKARGAIDFDTVETQIVLNDENHIEAIVPRHRNDAHRLIEEFMLLANVATAKYLEKNKQPAPYRVHQAPFAEKIKDLQSYLSIHGVNLKIAGDEVTPMDLAIMLDSIRDHDDFDNIQLMTLKSMNQAIYTPDNMGHFGLAYDAYTHFTSPIRRYPDLVVHRSIKSLIGEQSLGAKSYNIHDLNTICDHASTQERNADSASKEVENWLKCHFLKDKVGEILPAKITHITGFGMFAELKDIYIEGLIHISSLEGDYYVFDDHKHQLIGNNSKKVYAIGQEIEIRVVRVDMDNGHIDFELSSNKQSHPRPEKRRAHGVRRKRPDNKGKIPLPASDASPKKKKKKKPKRRNRNKKVEV